jgi:DNA-binding SARP family transcriptional activator
VTRSFRLAVCLSLGLVALLAPRAAAQPTPEPLEDYAAFGLSRIALLDLRMQGSPTEDDYRIAMLGLDLARTYAPSEPILLRRQIEAAWSAGLDDRALELTRQLIKLDPADDVALLRVVAAGIENIQTVEERLSAYERLLRAESVSAAVRSRLALDAALLARETGNERRFVDLLATAAELDSTNKEAAALALAYYDQAGGSSVGRVEMLANLLLADPVDPQVHAQLSDFLARNGAFEQAIRFHDHHQSLLLAAGRRPQAAAALRRTHLRWLAFGPAGLADELELPVLQERSRLARMLRMMRERGEETQGMQQPEDILPPPDAALLRMVLADAGDDPTAASRASEDLRGSTAERLSQMLLATQGDRDQARRVALLATQVRAETALSMVLSGVQLELVRVDIRQANEAMDRALADEAILGEIDPAMIVPAQEQLGLVVALMDTIDAAGTPEADERLADLKRRMDERTAPMAALAYAHALIVHQRTLDAVPLLRLIIREDPASTWGAWAHQELLELGFASPYPDADAIAAAARAIPDWLDRMVEKPENYMEMSVEAIESSEHVTDITRLRLTLRNNSPIPLAVGPSSPINSRLLLSPVLDADLDRLTPVAIPEVSSIDTRLRLMPRERLVIDVWAGAGLAGWYLEAAGQRTTRTRWRALQGFIYTQGASYQPGPMCLSAETGLMVRRPLPEINLGGQRIITRLLADDPAVVPTISATIKSALIGPGTPPRGRDPEPFVPVMQAAGQRLAQSPELVQITMMVALPNGKIARAAEPFDRIALDNAVAPIGLATALLTRASDPDDPAFARAFESEDARLQELAGLLQARLRAGGRSYANYQGFGPPQSSPPAGATTSSATP